MNSPGATASIGMVAVLLVAGCASQPSMPDSASRGCSGDGAVQTGIGGEAIMGAGSDGFISDTDVVFSARITPGRTGCTRVGGSIGS